MARVVSPYMANGNISEYMHRDQTSMEANVLISDEPDAVLCDFGMNTAVEAYYPGSELLQKTSKYNSPELLQKAEPEPTLQSDVWAWTCTTFEVITNCAPYPAAKSVNEILSAMAQGEPPGRIEQLHGLIHESNKQFHESLEVL
ncbi:hypothetical protein FRC00_013122, partial [Tulasnella sp. 408]